MYDEKNVFLLVKMIHQYPPLFLKHSTQGTSNFALSQSYFPSDSDQQGLILQGKDETIRI